MINVDNNSNSDNINEEASSAGVPATATAVEEPSYLKTYEEVKGEFDSQLNTFQSQFSESFNSLSQKITNLENQLNSEDFINKQVEAVTKRLLKINEAVKKQTEKEAQLQKEQHRIDYT